MKTPDSFCSLCLGLFAALWLPMVAAAAPEPVADLGRVLCVGDSITHGKSSGSWRWEFFKILVDNGVRWQEVGVQSGNYNGRGGIAPGTHYRGVAFANRHAAQFSEKAAEVAGRLSEPARMGGTGIRHWLRLEGKPGDAWQLAEGETPETFLLAIGTNDFVAGHSSSPGALAAARKQVQAQLIGRRRGKTWSGKGDMDTIVEAMREANPAARIVVIAIPTYSDAQGRWCHKAITAKDYEALAGYNRALRQWGAARRLHAVIDMNAGFRDVTKVGAAVPTMLVDQMHPNAQGNLIYAGNVAKGLGYAGRTAGLPRRAASAFPSLPEASGRQEATLRSGKGCTLAAGGRLEFPGVAGAQGGTVELDLGAQGLGNGARGGWRGAEHPLRVCLTAPQGQSSQLQLAEDGLRWGGRVLYSADMSRAVPPIRLVWHAGRPAEGIAGGFYVWLGDMLVGEALAGAQGETTAGLCLMAGELAVTSLRLSYDPASAWAPPTERFSAGESR